MTTPANPVTRDLDPVPLRRAVDVARAVRAVDGVADLHAGRFGEVALLYPRRRVAGLRVTLSPTPRLEVHILADLRARRPLAQVAAAVREAVVRGGMALPVDVIIADATDGGPE